MKKLGYLVAALAVALSFSGGTADAAKRAKVVVTPAPVYAPWWGYWAGTPWGVRDPRLATSNLVVGGAATGMYYGLYRNGHYWNGAKKGVGIHSAGAAYVASSAACAAASPIIGTLVAQRELTKREVFVSTANCFAPFVGGWMMNYWFDYYGWDRPQKKRR